MRGKTLLRVANIQEGGSDTVRKSLSFTVTTKELPGPFVISGGESLKEDGGELVLIKDTEVN